MSWSVINLLAALFMPPLFFLILLAIAIHQFHRKPKFARALLFLIFGLLYLAATPYCSEAMLHTLEDQHRALQAPYPDADVIVVLGGGSYLDAPEYSHIDTVSDATLVRLRYAASLQRATGKPILVSGGCPLGNQSSEAAQMKSVLEQDFGVPVRWTEDASNNTYENALYSYVTLHPQGLNTIYLVTHASHMPRAVISFQQAGFKVIAAPTTYTHRNHLGVLAFVPDAESLRDSKFFIHEMIGILWYRIKSATN